MPPCLPLTAALPPQNDACRRLAELKKEGKELPTSMDALEQQLGTWRQYKSEHENADGSSSAAVPLGHLGHKGRPCPLAGVPVGRNTK